MSVTLAILLTSVGVALGLGAGALAGRIIADRLERAVRESAARVEAVAGSLENTRATIHTRVANVAASLAKARNQIVADVESP